MPSNASATRFRTKPTAGLFVPLAGADGEVADEQNDYREVENHVRQVCPEGLGAAGNGEQVHQSERCGKLSADDTDADQPISALGNPPYRAARRRDQVRTGVARQRCVARISRRRADGGQKKMAAATTAAAASNVVG
jgi:hypothetical protein